MRSVTEDPVVVVDRFLVQGRLVVVVVPLEVCCFRS